MHVGAPHLSAMPWRMSLTMLEVYHEEQVSTIPCGCMHTPNGGIVMNKLTIIGMNQ